MKTATLINEIISAFQNSLAPDAEYLLTEYNSLIKTLLLMLPEGDGIMDVTAESGEAVTDLSPLQIKRVFYKNSELLRASDTLRTLLPSGMLYTPKDGKILVTVNGECRVFYRTLPDEVSSENLETADFPLDLGYIPLVRAWLWHRVYLYVGDTESANTYAEEYNRLLDEYKYENGVARCI